MPLDCPVLWPVEWDQGIAAVLWLLNPEVLAELCMHAGLFVNASMLIYLMDLASVSNQSWSLRWCVFLILFQLLKTKAYPPCLTELGLMWVGRNPKHKVLEMPSLSWAARNSEVSEFHLTCSGGTHAGLWLCSLPWHSSIPGTHRVTVQ